MKFREEPEYQRYFDTFGETLKSHYEMREAGDKCGGLEEIMLHTRRWVKFIRANASNLRISTAVAPRPIDTAIFDAVSILDEPLEMCVPLYREVEALEVLSFSAYVELKKNGEIYYCDHCKKFLTSPCKTHKKPTSADDLVYCSGCRGYLTTMCLIHDKKLQSDSYTKRTM